MSSNENDAAYEKGYNISPDLDVFNQWIIKNYGGNTRTKTITHEKFLRIRNLIRGDTANTNAKFRFWVRNKGFRLIHFDEKTGKIRDDPDGELYVSLHAREESAGGGNIESFLRTNLPAISFFRKVAVVEDFYEIIKKAHIDTKGQHAGQKKTYRLVSDTYAFLPREVITFYLLNCDACKPRIQKYGPIPKPKKSQECDANNSFDAPLINDDSCSPINVYDDRSTPSRTSEADYLKYDFGKIYSDEFLRNNSVTYSKLNGLNHFSSTPLEGDARYDPPSLCFIPKTKMADESFSLERPKSVEIPYTVPSGLPAMSESFYNREQLRDIENYARERRKIFEQSERQSANRSSKNYDLYTASSSKSYYRKRSLEDHADSQSVAKYQKKDAMLIPTTSYNQYELNKKLYEETLMKSKRMELPPLDLRPPQRAFHSPLFHTRRMLSSFGHGSVSSGSSDSTDEQKDEEDFSYHSNLLNFGRASPLSRDYNRNITKSLMPNFIPPVSRFVEHQITGKHGIQQLLYPYKEKLY